MKFLAWLLAVGCGSAPVVIDGGPDGDLPDTAIEPPEEGAPIDAGDDGDVLVPPAMNEGYAAVIQIDESYAAAASFSLKPLAGGCSAKQNVGGTCDYLSCGYVGTRVSAGTVTITGTTPPFTLTPTGGSYPIAQDFGTAWNGGDTLSLSVAGSTSVPAFSLDIIGPDRATVTKPVVVQQTDVITVDKSQPFVVNWNSAGKGQVRVKLVHTISSAKYDLILCTFPATALTGSIPPTAIAKVPTATDFNVTTYAEATLVKNGWSLAFFAENNITSAKLLVQ